MPLQKLATFGYFSAEEGQTYDYRQRLHLVELNVQRLSKLKRLHELKQRSAEQATNLVLLRSRITRENKIADQVSKGIIHPSTISGIAKILSRDIGSFRNHVLNQERILTGARRRNDRTASFREAVLQSNIVRLDSDDDPSGEETPPRVI